MTTIGKRTAIIKRDNRRRPGANTAGSETKTKGKAISKTAGTTAKYVSKGAKPNAAKKPGRVRKIGVNSGKAG